MGSPLGMEFLVISGILLLTHSLHIVYILDHVGMAAQPSRWVLCKHTSLEHMNSSYYSKGTVVAIKTIKRSAVSIMTKSHCTSND